MAPVLSPSFRVKVTIPRRLALLDDETSDIGTAYFFVLSPRCLPALERPRLAAVRRGPALSSPACSFPRPGACLHVAAPSARFYRLPVLLNTGSHGPTLAMRWREGQRPALSTLLYCGRRLTWMPVSRRHQLRGRGAGTTKTLAVPSTTLGRLRHRGR
jgi:hypothetical protein